MKKKTGKSGSTISRIIVHLTIGVILLTFTSGGIQEEAPAAVMLVGWGVEPDSLSPFISYTQAGAEVFNLIYDPLVSFDENLQLRPNLAAEWTQSADQLTWTFTLRDDVSWHDGEPLTSEDVKFTYDRMKESGLGLHAGFLTGISSVECPDPHTVVINNPAANCWRDLIPRSSLQVLTLS